MKCLFNAVTKLDLSHWYTTNAAIKDGQHLLGNFLHLLAPHTIYHYWSWWFETETFECIRFLDTKSFLMIFKKQVPLKCSFNVVDYWFYDFNKCLLTSVAFVIKSNGPFQSNLSNKWWNFRKYINLETGVRLTVKVDLLFSLRN